jgi:hypothetical protein
LALVVVASLPVVAVSLLVIMDLHMHSEETQPPPLVVVVVVVDQVM